MPSAWEIEKQRNERVLLGVIMPPDTKVTMSWATVFRQLELPPGSEVVKTSGQPFHVARNLLADYAYKQGFGGIFFLDSDTVPPPDALSRLLQTGRDLVGGLYFRRFPPYEPASGVIARAGEGGVKVAPPAYHPGDVVRVDFLASGCTYISYQCLEMMFRHYARPYDWGADIAPVPDGQGGNLPGFSEDYIFSVRAAALGFTPYLHTGIECEHEIHAVVKRMGGEVHVSAGVQE